MARGHMQHAVLQTAAFPQGSSFGYTGCHSTNFVPVHVHAVVACPLLSMRSLVCNPQSHCRVWSHVCLVTRGSCASIVTSVMGPLLSICSSRLAWRGLHTAWTFNVLDGCTWSTSFCCKPEAQDSSVFRVNCSSFGLLQSSHPHSLLLRTLAGLLASQQRAPHATLAQRHICACLQQH